MNVEEQQMQSMMLEIKEKFKQELGKDQQDPAQFRRLSSRMPDIATSVSPSMSLLTSLATAQNSILKNSKYAVVITFRGYHPRRALLKETVKARIYDTVDRKGKTRTRGLYSKLRQIKC